jgi:hypothetical protein
MTDLYMIALLGSVFIAPHTPPAIAYTLSITCMVLVWLMQTGVL